MNMLVASPVAVAVASPSVADQALDAKLVQLGRQHDFLERRYKSACQRLQPFWDEHKRRLDEWAATHPDRQPGDSMVEYDRLAQEIGLGDAEKADAHPDDLMDATDPIARQILAIPAITLAGLQVKARLAKFAASEIWKASDDDADWDDLCLRNVIDSVLALGSPDQRVSDIVRHPVDIELQTAAYELPTLDHRIEGLHSTFGDEADSRDDYEQIERRRFDVLDILARTPSRSRQGMRAKALALTQPTVAADYERTGEIAASLADDLLRMPAVV